MPLYVDNAEAERILREGGKRPYKDDEWQLVQTWLIRPSGELSELWRPQRGTGATDGDDLLAALDRAIARMGLKGHSPLADRAAKELRPGEARVLEAVVRLKVPQDGDYLGRTELALDRVGLTAEDCADLLPPGRGPYEVPPGTAARLLIHLRPPLDAAQDPEDEALQRVVQASLEGTPLTREQDVQVVALEGRLTMARPESAARPPQDGRYWTEILRAQIAVRGYLEWNPDRRELLDLQLVTESARFVPPGGRTVFYRGMIRPR